MTDFKEELIKNGFENTIFDLIRIININDKSLCYENNLSSKPTQFDYNQKKCYYQKCISSNTILNEIEHLDDKLFLMTFIPINTVKGTFVVECIADITYKTDTFFQNNEKKSFHNTMYSLTFTDELTKIYNRRYINKMLPFSIENCVKKSRPFSVIFADLDKFKKINDTYGHDYGDFILCEFASILEKTTQGKNNWAARYGGDEFLVFLENTDIGLAKETAEEIRKSIETKGFNCGKSKVKLTCSLGVYSLNTFEKIPTTNYIFKAVDRNLYTAKKSGRNMIVY